MSYDKISREIEGKFRQSKKSIMVLCGTTASGKSAIAQELCRLLDGVIINADSTQLYKGLEIITDQPNPILMKKYSHKLYGFLECLSRKNEANDTKQHYSVDSWLKESKIVINDTINSGSIPILVGGTGMYISSLIDGFSNIPTVNGRSNDLVQSLIIRALTSIDCRECHENILNGNFVSRDHKGHIKKVSHVLHNTLQIHDPESAKKIKANDLFRITRALSVLFETGFPMSYWHKNKIVSYERSNFFVIMVKCSRESLIRNINYRCANMIKNGAIEEVRTFIESSFIFPMAIGVSELSSHIRGYTSLEDAIELMQVNTRRYAKRQSTWFRNKISGYDMVVDTDSFDYIEQ